MSVCHLRVRSYTFFQNIFTEC